MNEQRNCDQTTAEEEGGSNDQQIEKKQKDLKNSKN
jgi:hypothetical protein